MPLPFFKKSAKSDDAVEVAATPVVSGVAKALPPVIATIAPDLGDYQVEYPEPIPQQWKWIPFAFFGCIVATAAFYLVSYQQMSANQARLATAQASLRNEVNNKSKLTEKASAFDSKMSDLQALSYWVDNTAPAQKIIASVTKVAATKVAIKSIELSRREGSAVRYSLIVNCAGTTDNFATMRSELTKALTDAQWAVVEAAIDPTDMKLVYDAQLTLVKKSNQTAE